MLKEAQTQTKLLETLLSPQAVPVDGIQWIRLTTDKGYDIGDFLVAQVDHPYDVITYNHRTFTFHCEVLNPETKVRGWVYRETNHTYNLVVPNGIEHLGR